MKLFTENLGQKLLITSKNHCFIHSMNSISLIIARLKSCLLQLFCSLFEKLSNDSENSFKKKLLHLYKNTTKKFCSSTFDQHQQFDWIFHILQKNFSWLWTLTLMKNWKQFWYFVTWTSFIICHSTFVKLWSIVWLKCYSDLCLEPLVFSLSLLKFCIFCIFQLSLILKSS